MSVKKTWLELKNEGSRHFKDRRWLEGMNCYTFAIRMKSDEAVLYSNRAICEIQLKKFELAREDAETAVRLDPRNVKYYRVLSEALMGLQSFEKALEACEKGLNLDPREPTLLVRQRDCQTKVSSRKQRPQKSEPQKHKETSPSKPNGDEKDGKSKIEFQPPLPDDVEICGSSNFDEYVHLSLGHAHLRYPTYDEKIALQFFERAAKSGSPEALYQLGLMHFNGKGELPDDPHKALELWRKAAACKPYRKRGDEIERNPGVADSENALGNAYRDGKGVEQNDAEAFKWYERAANHGCCESWKALASFLESGKGCQKDPAGAEVWLAKLADFEDGEDGREEDVSDEDEDDYPEDSKDSDLEEEYEDDEYFELNCLFRAAAGQLGSSLNQNPIIYDVSELLPAMMERRLQGWPSAKLFFAAFDKKAEAHELLRQKKYTEAFTKAREMMSTWNLKIFNPYPFIVAAKLVLRKDPKNHAALYVLAGCSRDINGKEQFRIAKRCVELDASVPEYHLLLAKSFTELQLKNEALDSIEKAVGMRLHPEWLYVKAVVLQNLVEANDEVVIAAYQQFLSSATSDFEDVPEAYFKLGYLYVDKDVDKAAALYRLGQIADHSSIRLPCLPDMEEDSSRLLLKLALKDEGRWPISKNVLDLVKMCVTCTKTESLFACVACNKTFYCSEQCQKNNWIIHRRICSH